MVASQLEGTVARWSCIETWWTLMDASQLEGHCG